MYAVILAGGSGTRLWPLSREQYPKYHLQVASEGTGSLFEQTVARVNTLVPEEKIIVVTHENQKSDLATVLGRNDKQAVTVIGEPQARNTAPAVGLAAWFLNARDPQAVMAVLPSDHYVKPDERFVELLEKASHAAARYGLVTFGIRPDAPETGYGYICCGDPLDSSTCLVDRFVEKPDLENARKFIQDERYLWNSGMFVFHVPSLMDEFRRHLPEIADLLDRLDLEQFSNLPEIYEQMPSISIDYGIMEKAERIAVIPADINWSDVGSWESYYHMLTHDENKNALQGRVHDVDTTGSLVISPDRVVGTIGLKNMIVIDTPDALLICDRDKTQDVRTVVEKLKEEDAEEASIHRTVYRPWGSYTVIADGEGFQVKTIIVNPGHRLSLQRHRYRSENWVVVNGTARVTLDESVHDLSPGESIFIPIGSLHRLENTTGEMVQIVEVQNGSYLGEDDIERISDDYDRVNNPGTVNDSPARNNFQTMYEKWLNHPGLDERTKKELLDIGDDPEEIENRFASELQFGTGGFRGIIGAGPNRINSFVVRRATQGLANYINDTYPEEPDKKVAIAYDSRHFSREFAQDAALVLCANGIKACLFEELRPTPLLSFAIRELGCLAGIVITASHNPSRYNGYKVYGRDGGQAVPSLTTKLTEYIARVDVFDDVKHISRDEAERKELLIAVGKEIDDLYLANVKTLCRHEGNKDLRIVYTPLHGTGYPLIPRLLEELEYRHLFMVPEQVSPDPDFPTVKTPNPEDREVFTMALSLARKENAEIILATDPDCDRVGCAVKDKHGEYTLLNGNQIGALLVNYLLQGMKEDHSLPSNGVIIKTIVTGNLGKVIATDYGIETIETLTGFKFIGEKIKEFEESGTREFIAGYEESYGYLAGTFVRDKDGVISAALITEMAAYYRSRGKSLLDVLEELNQKYGYFIEELQSIELENPAEAEKMIRVLSEVNLDRIAGIAVAEKKDFMKGKAIEPRTMATRDLPFPRTEAILFDLEDGSWFCVRPSGTEPKFKIYYSTNGKNYGEARQRMDRLTEEVQVILESKK